MTEAATGRETGYWIAAIAFAGLCSFLSFVLGRWSGQDSYYTTRQTKIDRSDWPERYRVHAWTAFEECILGDRLHVVDCDWKPDVDYDLKQFGDDPWREICLLGAVDFQAVHNQRYSQSLFTCEYENWKAQMLIRYTVSQHQLEFPESFLPTEIYVYPDTTSNPIELPSMDEFKAYGQRPKPFWSTQ